MIPLSRVGLFYVMYIAGFFLLLRIDDHLCVTQLVDQLAYEESYLCYNFTTPASQLRTE